jgi:hypothetical protein
MRSMRSIVGPSVDPTFARLLLHSIDRRNGKQELASNFKLVCCFFELAFVLCNER